MEEISKAIYFFLKNSVILHNDKRVENVWIIFFKQQIFLKPFTVLYKVDLIYCIIIVMK